MNLGWQKKQDGTDRRQRRRVMLSLFCALLFVLATAVVGPVLAFDKMDLAAVSTHMADGAPKHCPSSDQHPDQSAACAFAVGCTVFLSATYVRLPKTISAPRSIPPLAVQLYGQIPPPLVHPPRHTLPL